MGNHKKIKIVDFKTIVDNAKNIKNNKYLEQNKKVSLILEKICNERIITNEFLDSISMEDIMLAQEVIMSTNSSLILEMQKNTFLETIINKEQCVQTENTEDFF